MKRLFVILILALSFGVMYPQEASNDVLDQNIPPTPSILHYVHECMEMDPGEVTSVHAIGLWNDKDYPGFYWRWNNIYSQKVLEFITVSDPVHVELVQNGMVVWDTILTVSLEDCPNSHFNVFPNPTTGPVTIEAEVGAAIIIAGFDGPTYYYAFYSNGTDIINLPYKGSFLIRSILNGKESPYKYKVFVVN